MLNTITYNRQIHIIKNSAQRILTAAFGWKTLIIIFSFLITTGVYSQHGNTAFGSSSLLNNTTGALNSAFGYQSLYANTTGYTNSAFGYISLANNTTGIENSAFGENSLSNNTTGNTNSAFGSLSLYSNTIGNQNSAFGFGSLFSNTSGGQNSSFGISSLYSNSSGVSNVAFGYSTLYRNTIGMQNSAFGNYALNNVTTGRNNTGIGYNAQVPSNTAYNQVRIGNTSVTYAGIQVAWTITSDRRWKQNILNSNLGLGFISKLNPVSYTRINDEIGKTEYGFIAQEVEEVLKEEGVENSGMLTLTDEGMYELRYNDLLAPMVKAIQELKSENDELKDKLAKFEQIQSVMLNEIEKMKLNDSEIKEVKLVVK